MDKNIKTELEILKNQIVTTLNNIEKALATLDNRVEDVTEKTLENNEKLKTLVDNTNWNSMKDIKKVIREAMDLDTQEYQEFVVNWNKQKIQRILRFREILKTCIAEVDNFQISSREVKTLADAQNITNMFEQFEQLKIQVAEILHDTKILDQLEANDSELDFKIFYDFQVDIANRIMQIKVPLLDNTFQARILQTLASLVYDRELESIRLPEFIDPETFEPKPMSGDPEKLLAYRKMEFNRYQKALKHALDYVNKKSDLKDPSFTNSLIFP